MFLLLVMQSCFPLACSTNVSSESSSNDNKDKGNNGRKRGTGKDARQWREQESKLPLRCGTFIDDVGPYSDIRQRLNVS